MITIAVTTVCWLATAYLGADRPRVLINFYRKVHPMGPAGAVTAKAG